MSSACSGNRKYQQLSIPDVERLRTIYALGLRLLEEHVPQDLRTYAAIQEMIDKASTVKERTGGRVSICLAHAVGRGSLSKLIVKNGNGQV